MKNLYPITIDKDIARINIRGDEVLVDADILQGFLKYRWHINKRKKTVQTSIGSRLNRHTMYLHHFVMGQPPKGKETDHINHNGLDNRRENLRFVTHGQNLMNQRMKRNNTSGYKGVSRCGNSWKAQIQLNGKHIHLGYFKTKIEAARIYNQTAKELFGQYAYLNMEVLPVGDCPH